LNEGLMNAPTSTLLRSMPLLRKVKCNGDFCVVVDVFQQFFFVIVWILHQFK